MVRIHHLPPFLFERLERQFVQYFQLIDEFGVFETARFYSLSVFSVPTHYWSCGRKKISNVYREASPIQVRLASLSSGVDVIVDLLVDCETLFVLNAASSEIDLVENSGKTPRKLN
jgi:hypothetical protein